MTSSVRRVPGSSAAIFAFDKEVGTRATHTPRRVAARAVVICGEPGSGRTTAARSLADETATWVDASDASEPGAQQWLSRLRDNLETETCVVIEAVDELPASLARRTAECLRSGRARVILTCGPAEGLDADHAALIAQCAERVELRPLRHRRTEVPALVKSILEQLGTPPQLRFTPAALEALSGQEWTGNLRELYTAVKTVTENRRVGDVTVSDLPVRYRARITRSLTPMEQAERETIVAALQDSHGNKKAAAKQLGISRSTLYNAIRSYGILT